MDFKIDDLLKAPSQFTSAKRKRLPSSADEHYKKVKEQEEEQDDQTSQLPDDFFEDEDERFMGDGLTEEQRRILDLVDEVAEEPEAIDAPTLKKMIIKFEKCVSKNQELRLKFPDQPVKFMDSEADLDEELKIMMGVSSVPELYPLLVEYKTVDSIASLLSHENTDIALAVVALINELTDEDVVAETEDEGAEGMKKLVDAFMGNQVLQFMVGMLSKLDEANNEDKQGVFNILGVVENFISVDPNISELIVSDTTILQFLLTRIQVAGFDSNRQYASELLSILLQTSRPNRLKLGEIDGMDVLLMVIAQYKKKDPKEPDEIEMMENFFDCCCSCLLEPELKVKFLDGEGLELMLLLLKNKRMSRMRAMKVIDHALLGPSGKQNCAKLVDLLGLKTLFANFMKKGFKSYKKEYPEFSESKDEEHILSSILSLLKNATPDILPRLYAKFTEDSYEKVDRLIELYIQYTNKLNSFDEARELVKLSRQEDEKDEDEDEIYMDRLDNGLFLLQLVNLIILFLCGSEDEWDERGLVLNRIKILLEVNGGSLEFVTLVIQEFINNIGEISKEEVEEKERITRLLANFENQIARNA